MVVLIFISSFIYISPLFSIVVLSISTDSIPHFLAFVKGLSFVFNAFLLFFAFSTILSWHFFAAVNVKYLFGEAAVKVFSSIVLIFIVVGSTLKVDLVWELADFFNGLMVFPNLLALLALSGVVVASSKKFDKKNQ